MSGFVYNFCQGEVRTKSDRGRAIQAICKQIQQYHSVFRLLICVKLSVLPTLATRCGNDAPLIIYVRKVQGFLLLPLEASFFWLITYVDLMCYESYSANGALLIAKQ